MLVGKWRLLCISWRARVQAWWWPRSKRTVRLLCCWRMPAHFCYGKLRCNIASRGVSGRSSGDLYHKCHLRFRLPTGWRFVSFKRGQSGWGSGSMFAIEHWSVNEIKPWVPFGLGTCSIANIPVRKGKSWLYRVLMKLTIAHVLLTYLWLTTTARALVKAVCS